MFDQSWIEDLAGVDECIKSSGFQVPSGSHSTCDDGIMSILYMMNAKEGEVLWDVGVGNPKLSFFYSYMTNTTVVGTDIGENHYALNNY